MSRRVGAVVVFDERVNTLQALFAGGIEAFMGEGGGAMRQMEQRGGRVHRLL